MCFYCQVGDSRCLVIGADGSVKFTTEDHTPEDEAEAARIRAAGGSIRRGRVDGHLSLSRSIGDVSCKVSCRKTPPTLLLNRRVVARSSSHR